MFKGALFDLDGVIANTADLHFKAWQQLAHKHFKMKLPKNLELQTKGISRSDSLQVILDFLKIKLAPKDFEQLTIEKNIIYQNYLNSLTSANILPGIKPLLIELKAKKIRLALASASQNGPLILQKLGLNTLFDAIIDPNQLAHGKPAPDIFIVAAKELALVPQECVAFEDSIAGITAINKSGAVSIAIGKQFELKAAHSIVTDTSQLNLTMITTAFINAHKE